jgi:hypothetical protein
MISLKYDLGDEGSEGNGKAIGNESQKWEKRDLVSNVLFNVGGINRRIVRICFNKIPPNIPIPRMLKGGIYFDG